MKRVFLAVVSLLMAATVSAQDLRWGPTAAINLSWVNGQNITESNAHLGFNLGIKTELDFKDILAEGFYLEGKFLYTLKGGSWKSYHENLGYFEIPVNMGYRHAISQKISLMGSLGPYLGLGVLGKSVTKADGTKVKVDIFGQSYKRFDLGLNYNIGIELWKKWQFFIGMEHSLLNMAKIEKITFEGEVLNPDLKIKARPFNLYIGTAFMF